MRAPPPPCSRLESIHPGVGWGARVLLATWVILLVSACRSGPTQTQIAAADAAPTVRGSDNGLEVACWTLTSDPTTLANALAQYEGEPIDMDPAIRSLWEANGLRLVVVPASELEGVCTEVRLSGAVQRQWLGQAPLWTDAVPGPRWSGGRTIGIDSGPLRLGPGRLRLLARCWIVPVAPRRKPDELLDDPALAAMRIELLLQHQETQRPIQSGNDPLSRPTRVRTLEDEGLVFRRLAATLTLPAGSAVLIVPERPGVDWRSMGLAEPNPAAAELAPRTGGKPGETLDAGRAPPLGRVEKPAAAGTSMPETRREPEPTGPPTPLEDRPVTLGEALLGDAPISEVPSGRPARAVVVLIPHLPDRYRLLP